MNTNTKILLVDDDRECLNQAFDELRQMGFQNLKTADTPKDARKVFEAFQPEIVLMDIWLHKYYAPIRDEKHLDFESIDFDGIDLLVQLKEKGAALGINFLAVYLTGLETDEFINRSRSICPAFPLYKPLNSKDIKGLMSLYAERADTWATKMVNIPIANREYMQIDVSKIAYLTVYGDNVAIFDVQSKMLCLTTGKTLTSWVDYLNETHSVFLRVRDSIAINKNHIIKCDKSEISTLRGYNDSSICVTDKYIEAYRQALNLSKKGDNDSKKKPNE